MHGFVPCKRVGNERNMSHTLMIAYTCPEQVPSTFNNVAMLRAILMSMVARLVAIITCPSYLALPFASLHTPDDYDSPST